MLARLSCKYLVLFQVLRLFTGLSCNVLVLFQVLRLFAGSSCNDIVLFQVLRHCLLDQAVMILSLYKAVML